MKLFHLTLTNNKLCKIPTIGRQVSILNIQGTSNKNYKKIISKISFLLHCLCDKKLSYRNISTNSSFSLEIAIIIIMDTQIKCLY